MVAPRDGTHMPSVSLYGRAVAVDVALVLSRSALWAIHVSLVIVEAHIRVKRFAFQYTGACLGVRVPCLNMGARVGLVEAYATSPVHVWR